MPFCPKCRYEYEIRVSVCPDCQVPLVQTLSPEDSDQDVTGEDFPAWVRLARLTSREYALLLQVALDRRGVPTVLQSETGHFGALGYSGTSSLAPVGGGFVLIVPLEYVIAADVVGNAVLGEAWKKSRLIDLDTATPYEDEPDESAE